jgi:hypothetical protein
MHIHIHIHIHVHVHIHIYYVYMHTSQLRCTRIRYTRHGPYIHILRVSAHLPTRNKGRLRLREGFNPLYIHTHTHTHTHTKKGPVMDTRGVQTTKAPEEEATMVGAGGEGMEEAGWGGGVTGDIAR